MNEINEIFIQEAEKQKKNTDLGAYILMAVTIVLIIIGILSLAIISSLLATMLLLTSNTLQNKIFVLERELLEQDIEEHLKK